MVDTLGLVITVEVHSASIQDRDGIFLFKLNAKLQHYVGFLLTKDTKVNYKIDVCWKLDVC
ncbi:hypothetical protein [Wolbachia endosymbiont of Cylisticus convexus]|uniref:hypothetical protein n=1 Tax=Wolbachia endosymbiont of Cylisticus convexus TaxID=118728 RepID=UPI00397A4B3F